jgi:hypothetical protein
MWANCVATGLETSEDEVVCAILAGLPSDYDTIVTIVDDSGDKITLDALLPKLMRIEGRLGAAKDYTNSDYRAFYTKSGRGPAPGGRRPAIITCHYCGKLGHKEIECNSKRPHQPAQLR